MTPAPLGVGTVFKQAMKGPGGRRIDGDYEITRVKPNELVEFKVIAGPARPVGVYTLAGAGSATTVTFALDLPAKGLMRLMDGMIANTMKAEVANLENMKTYLETPH